MIHVRRLIVSDEIRSTYDIQYFSYLTKKRPRDLSSQMKEPIDDGSVHSMNHRSPSLSVLVSRINTVKQL